MPLGCNENYWRDRELKSKVESTWDAGVDAGAASCHIALVELMVIVAYLNGCRSTVTGKNIIYLGDNRAVQRWLHKRSSKNEIAHFLLAQLNALELVLHFHLLAAYITTSHNVTADDLTRVSWSDLEAYTREKGLKPIELSTPWCDILNVAWKDRIFRWQGQSKEELHTATQLALLRRGSTAICDIPSLVTRGGCAIWEVASNLGRWAHEAHGRGIDSYYSTWAKRLPQGEIYPAGAKFVSPGSLPPGEWAVKVVIVSVATGEPHEIRKLLAKPVSGWTPHVVLVDCPVRKGPNDEKAWETLLAEFGLNPTSGGHFQLNIGQLTGHLTGLRQVRLYTQDLLESVEMHPPCPGKEGPTESDSRLAGLQKSSQRSLDAIRKDGN